MSESNPDQENRVCPHCKGTDIVIGIQTEMALVYSIPALFGTKQYIPELALADLCKTCGTVVRVYILNTDKTWETSHSDTILSNYRLKGTF